MNRSVFTTLFTTLIASLSLALPVHALPVHGLPVKALPDPGVPVRALALAPQAASIAGVWLVEPVGPGALPTVLKFSGADGAFSGTWNLGFGDLPLQAIQVTGQSISYELDLGDRSRRTVTATLDSDALHLSMQQFPEWLRGGGPRAVTAQRASGVQVAELDSAAAVRNHKLPLPPLHDVPDNGLARTPPMGWNSWYAFGVAIDDPLVRSIVDAMVASGLRDAGYIYVNLDAGWRGARDPDGTPHANSRFPDMKSLADYIHAHGMKLGLYSSPAPVDCANYPGSHGYESEDAQAFAQWGVDYLKYDWCTAGALYPSQHEMQALYQKMAEALRATQRPIVFSLSQSGMFDVGSWARSVGANVWRATSDLRDDWAAVSRNGFENSGHSTAAGPGGWNDPDMLQIGNGGMSVEEYRTQMTLWSMLAAPLLIGSDPRKLSSEAQKLLLNREVVAVDQDALGQQGQRVVQRDATEIWLKPLANGDVAVALFNRGEHPARMAVRWSDVGVDAVQGARDLWRHVDLPSTAESFASSVPGHGSVLLRVSLRRHTDVAGAGRQSESLDGQWDIADSVLPTDRPKRFNHRGPVPGLAHSATPAFADVDRYDSTEALHMRPSHEEVPGLADVKGPGISHQKRNYFWYHRAFTAPAATAVARLRVAKAQFGSQVWVNGQLVGEHANCFTAAIYDISHVIRWSRQNEVLIRVGAHPGVLPPGNACQSDFERAKQPPGVWDSVALWYSDNPILESIQVAPRLEPRQILIETRLRNLSGSPVTTQLRQSVHPWKQDAVIVGQTSQTVTLAPGEEQKILQTVALPGASLWTPEDPNLYVLDTTTAGDEAQTRFGVREFRFDTPTQRAYLNGKPYFLRGANITLHRFFGDPLSGELPWDERWIRKVLGENTRQMHWNTIKFCVGVPPEKWLDIADETGLLVDDEFPVWSLKPPMPPGYTRGFDTETLLKDFSEWLQDSWNHPSVAFWSGSEESALPVLAQKVLPAVRSLDLSNRPWGNGWNVPGEPDDFSEQHNYEFMANAFPGSGAPFDMVELEKRNGAEKLDPASIPSGHATIIGEYGWLWVNRDGTLPFWTRNVYPTLPYPHATPQERLETQAYLLAGLTEYWRAYRHFAGVLYFVYLGESDPDGYTSDNFSNVRSATLNPYFATYMGDASKPLGVYINFWHRELEEGAAHEFQVMMVNDDPIESRGSVALRLEDSSGQVVARTEEAFRVAAHGQQTHVLKLDLPHMQGQYWLKAIATPSVGMQTEPTTSRRHLSLVGTAPAPSK